MKTVKEFILQDCQKLSSKYKTWEQVEKHVSYDIYGTVRLMEEYAQ